MTEQTARRDLKTLRADRRWSFDHLAMDMRAVLGRDNTPTSRTLNRFEAGTHKAHAHTLADVADYLKAAKKRKAA